MNVNLIIAVNIKTVKYNNFGSFINFHLPPRFANLPPRKICDGKDLPPGKNGNFKPCTCMLMEQTDWTFAQLIQDEILSKNRRDDNHRRGQPLAAWASLLLRFDAITSYAAFQVIADVYKLQCRSQKSRMNGRTEQIHGLTILLLQCKKLNLLASSTSI